MDWTGLLFFGVTLYCKYEKRYVYLFIPGYTNKALQKYQHTPPVKPQLSPHKHAPINYWYKVKQDQEDDTYTTLNKEEICHVQEIVGTLLY